MRSPARVFRRCGRANGGVDARRNAGTAHRDVVSGTGGQAQAIAEFEKKAAALEGTRPVGGGGSREGVAAEERPHLISRGRGNGTRSRRHTGDTLWATVAALTGVMNAMQAADVAPTTNTLNAIAAAQARRARHGGAGNIAEVDLPALNVKLKAAGGQGVK